MINKELYIVCGLPGAGKSTFIRSLIHPNVMHDKIHYGTMCLDNGAWCNNGSAWISRDDIRFSMLSDGDQYFDKEKEVYKEYIRKINDALRDDNIRQVFADATHLTESSRNKLLSNVNTSGVNVYVMVFDVGLNKCILNNLKRIGTKRYVPTDVIIKMSERFEKPEACDAFNVITITGEDLYD